MQALEDPERLGDRERRVVRQHDAAAADPDGARWPPATVAIITIGALLATLPMLWCSASQKRW